MTAPTSSDRVAEWRTERAQRAENTWIVGLLMAIATTAALGAALSGATIPALGCALVALAPAAIRVTHALQDHIARRRETDT